MKLGANDYISKTMSVEIYTKQRMKVNNIRAIELL